MKGRVVALGMFRDREAAALVEDGKLTDFVIAPRDEDTLLPGAIYRGTVGRLMKGMGGVFVDLGHGQTGFLRNAKGVSPGQSLLVQIHASAEAGKAAPVTTRLIFRGKTVHLTPGVAGINVARAITDEDRRGFLRILAEDVMDQAAQDIGAIIRSCAIDADEDDIAQELLELLTLAQSVVADDAGQPELLVAGTSAHEYAWREWDLGNADEVLEGNDAFENAQVISDIEALFQPLVSLRGQATMYIEPTRALVAVDVNTGNSGNFNAGLAANIAAAEALPRQLKLRGLGGQITLDFAPCGKADRKRIEQTLAKALRAEGIETSLVGWTPIGHFELNRKRERMPV
jgi:ribonuclease G